MNHPSTLQLFDALRPQTRQWIPMRLTTYRIHSIHTQPLRQRVPENCMAVHLHPARAQITKALLSGLSQTQRGRLIASINAEYPNLPQLRGYHLDAYQAWLHSSDSTKPEPEEWGTPALMAGDGGKAKHIRLCQQPNSDAFLNQHGLYCLTLMSGAEVQYKMDSAPDPHRESFRVIWNGGVAEPSVRMMDALEWWLDGTRVGA